MGSSPAEASATAAAKRVGQVVSDRYHLMQLLGEGAMGAVYLAEHTHMKKRVALKLLHAELSGDRAVLARFEREAMAAAHIEHPNVAAATDFGRTEEGSFFLVLEYIEGSSLRQTIARGPIGVRRALHVVRQIALALDCAHVAGIVHRDLKPENVMLVDRGDTGDLVKVLDFGIAKLSAETMEEKGAGDQPLTQFGAILGTPEYMAPEQAMGGAVTAQTDLYALGVLFYELLTGVHPFEAATRVAMVSMHVSGAVPKMSERAPNVEVPTEVEAVVRRLLEKEPAARPPSARAVVEAIDACVAATTSPGGDGSPAPPMSIGRGPWSESDSTAKTSYGEPALPRPALPSAILLARLRAQPRGVQVLAASVAAAMVVLVLVLLARPRRAEDTSRSEGDAESTAVAAPERKVQAPPERLREAALSTSALRDLQKEYPEDVAVARQLVLAYRAEGRAGEALRTIRDVLRADPSSAADEMMLATVVATATQAKGEEADAAFELLENAFGPHGIDALIEMSEKSQPNVVARNRAGRSLAKGAVRAQASPAANVLLDLRAAKTCTARRELLPRARTNADQRVLAALKGLRKSGGCGFLGLGDCNACLRKDSELDDTISAIERRTPAP